LDDQYEALKQYPVSILAQQFELSEALVKGVHATLTNTFRFQPGRRMWESTLIPRWRYKDLPNGVGRRDGLLHQFCLPSEVPAAMAGLVEMFDSHISRASSLPDLVKGAWLHHRFMEIHPFAHGNGQAGRVLLSAFLMSRNLPPALIDMATKSEYIEAMDAANFGGPDALVAYIHGACERLLKDYCA